MRRLVGIGAIAAVVFLAVEIALMIVIGHQIGAAWTVLLVLATSALGVWLLRREGGRAWRAFREDVAQERPPGNNATEGVLVLVGGVLMVLPGFLGDVLGLLLITPPTRRAGRILFLRFFATRISPSAATSLFGPRRVRVRYGAPQHPSEPTQPPTLRPEARNTDSSPAIEGEIIDPR